jgi:hypothetical protein
MLSIDSLKMLQATHGYIQKQLQKVYPTYGRNDTRIVVLFVQ